MFVINFFRRITYWLRTIMRPFAVIGKMVKRVRIPPWVKYFLEFLLVATVIIVLALLNWWLGIDRYLTGPRYLRRIWLGLIAALVYLAIRLFIFVIGQIPSAEADFPDIDDAVEEGLGALDDARINIRDVPLYLVVGLTPEAEEAFCSSTQVATDVNVRSRRFPVHWFGNEKGIWVTLPGVSALSQQVQLATNAPLEDDAHGDAHSETFAAPPSPAPSGDSGRFATMAGAGGQGGRFETFGAGSAGGGTFATLPGGRAAGQGAPRTAGADRPSVRRLSLDDKELASLRIEYFVKLLRQARYPVCPNNAVLLVLPYEWTTSPGLSMLSDTIKVDMLTLQETLGTKCLCLTVFSGIERSADFSEYVSRLDRAQVERRCGCSFPPLTDLAPRDAEASHTWLMQYFERQIFELYQRKLGDPGNGKLFRLLDRLRKSRSNFARLLNNAFPHEVGSPFYFGGVYFAGIGTVSGVNLPFFDGVLAKLQHDHDEVIGWTDETLAEDQRYRTGAKFVTAAVVCLTIVAALVFLWILSGL